jgi:predicted ester cyclase
LHVTVEDVFGEADKVVARCTVRGTHLGHDIGIASTNASVSFGGMCIMRFEQGNIVEGWNSFDLHTLYQQIEMAETTQQVTESRKLMSANSAATRSVVSIPD